MGWSDGKVLSALADSLQPGLVDMKNVSTHIYVLCVCMTRTMYLTVLC